MERFFSESKTLAKLKQGPFWPFLEEFAEQLVAEGYVRESIRVQIKLIDAFGKWLRKNRIPLQGIDAADTKRFLKYRSRRQNLGRSDEASIKRLFCILRNGLVVAPEPMLVQTSAMRMAEKFACYLREERGLAASTIVRYQSVMLQFFNEVFGEADVELSEITPNHIIDFVRKQAVIRKTHAKAITSSLRSFLRYSWYQAWTSIDLSAAVPRVATWTMASIPKALPQDQVELLLAGFSRRTPRERRDYAILLLLARLGLRAGEIASLRLEDIDWEAGLVTVHGKTGHRPRLPLSEEVGRAISSYLHEGRPKTKHRAVFLRARAPVRGFRQAQAVTHIVERALTRAGIKSQRRGAHLFRHALATEMLRQGASLSEIGELLGHQKPDTTAIYAKVDLVSLRTLAMQWPGGGK